MPHAWAQTLPTGQAEPTKEQIQQACASDRAEKLPIPFSDIEPGHWAFKAVLYYCGGILPKIENKTSDSLIPSPPKSISFLRFQQHRE